MEVKMNQIIVLGNIYDETNTFCSNGRVYGGGGIAPTIGATNFGHERYVLLEPFKYEYELICCISASASEDFSFFSKNQFKCVKASNNDLSIVEKRCKEYVYGQLRCHGQS